MESDANGLSREAWLRERRRGIGGSEAAALFGVHPWVSPFALYQDKVGAVVDNRETPAMKWGRRLEPIVREAYAEEVGRVVGPGVVNRIHPELSFVIANTDGTIEPIPEFDGPGVYEGKASLSPFKRNEWDEGVPLYYQVQTQHYMAVLGWQWASVCVFLPGTPDPLMYCDVQRNDRFIAAMLEREEHFWRKHVEAKVPPDVDGSKATTRALQLLHPRDNGEVVVLPKVADEWTAELGRLRKQKKALEERESTLKNQLRAKIGKASYGVLPGGAGWSFKHQHRHAYRVEEKDTRPLRAASKKSIQAARRAAEERATEELRRAGVDVHV